MQKKEVYIGYPELITPFGEGLEINFQAMLKGEKAYKPFPKKLYGEDFPLKSAGILADYTFSDAPTDWTRSEKLLHRLVKNFLKNKTSVEINSCLLLYKNHNCYEKIDFKNLLNDQESVQKVFNYNGISLTTDQIAIIDNTCTTGLTLLTHAIQGVQSGLWENVFVAAIDLVDPFVTYLLNGLGALGEVSKPFDKDRSGFVKTESASCTYISTEPEKSLMSMLSYHQSNDAWRLTDGRDDCYYISHTMKKALELSGITEKDIAFIKAHGTSTQLNDLHEAHAILEVFKNKNIPVTSLKGHLGHTTDASGLVENLLAAYALKRNVIFKTEGCLNPDFKLNIIQETQKTQLPYFLSNSFGFGGNNASAIFKVL